MGRDKLSLTVDGKTLVARVHETLENRCEEILMVDSGNRRWPRPNRLKGVRRVSDLRPGCAGPLAGIEAALANARNDLVFVMAGDMPFLPTELVDSLLELIYREDFRVAVPRYDGRLHPLCAAYHREVLPDLSFVLNLGVRAVHTFLENLDGVRYVEDELALFGEPERFLMNVNSPEDLERAQRLSENSGW